MWDEFHDSTHLNAKSEYSRNAVYYSLPCWTCETSDGDTNDNTKEERFAKKSELLFHALSVDVQLVKTWNEVEGLANDNGERGKTLAERRFSIF